MRVRGLPRIVVVLAIVGASGCRTSDLAVRASDRLKFEAPDEMARVALPVVLRWRADGVRESQNLAGDGPFFALFVDRPPVPAGTGLATLVDEECERRPGCPDHQWLAEQDVYVTGEKTLTLARVPDTGTTRTGADGAHRVTAVLVGPDGVRIDEQVTAIEFQVVDR